jgi:hypothetical protein
MKLPAAPSALGSDFDEFLYAPVGESNDAMPLSVLSALARQNVDAWEEAAELAQLPKESAIARLTSMISSATVGSSPTPVPEATAARLVALLPRSGRFDISLEDTSSNEAPRNLAPVVIYIVVGALIMASALLGY